MVVIRFLSWFKNPLCLSFVLQLDTNPVYTTKVIPKIWIFLVSQSNIWHTKNWVETIKPPKQASTDQTATKMFINSYTVFLKAVFP